MEKETKKGLLPLNIQMFAEGGEGDEPKTPEVNLTSEQVETWLSTDEGKRFIQPKLDSNFSKGLNTWKENNLDKYYNDRYSKENPAETKEMKLIRELQSKLASQEAAALDATMNTLAVNELNDKSLPVEFAQYLKGSTEQETKMNVMEFENTFNKALQAAIDSKISSTKPKVGKTSTEPEADPFMSIIKGY